MADGEVNELAAKLQRRTQINDGEETPQVVIIPLSFPLLPLSPHNG
jgi:hypothetical protein